MIVHSYKCGDLFFFKILSSRKPVKNHRTYTVVDYCMLLDNYDCDGRTMVIRALNKIGLLRFNFKTTSNIPGILLYYSNRTLFRYHSSGQTVLGINSTGLPCET